MSMTDDLDSFSILSKKIHFCVVSDLIALGYYLDLKHMIAAKASAVTIDPMKANVIFFHTKMSSKIGVVVSALWNGEYTAI